MKAFSALYRTVFGGVDFNPDTDIPPLTGKVILVTGGNAGLGKCAIEQLAAHSPARIYLASRDASRAQSAIDDITRRVPSARTILKPLSLDLASFASIRAAAQQVLSESPRLDILMLNAGIMATPAATTVDGYEIQFGTNHVGHALLTKLLLPLLLRTANAAPETERPQADDDGPGGGAPQQAKPDVRVVVVSSMAHHGSARGGIDFAALKAPGPDGVYAAWARYAQSKLANILFADELARRHPGQLTAVSLHPGMVNTNIMSPFVSRHLAARAALRALDWAFFTTADRAARHQVWAATAREGVESGAYYHPIGAPGLRSWRARDKELARRLWEWTEKELEGVMAEGN